VIVLNRLIHAGGLDNLAAIAHDPRYRRVQGDIADAELVAGPVGEVQIIVDFGAETHVDRSIHEAEAFIGTDLRGTFE